VLEVHDFNIPDEPDSSTGGDDWYLGYDAGQGMLQPWPKIYRLVGDSDMAGNPLPRLSVHGSGARWLTADNPGALLSSDAGLRH
jgi:hypothetical protein